MTMGLLTFGAGLSLRWQLGMIVYLVVFLVLGLGMYFFVKGSGKQYIIAGKSLPFFLVGTTMLAQSLDANATMGNAGGTYSAGFWAGFQFPLGLALCLVVTGTWFAKPLNRMNLITLPDFYYRRYNNLVEMLSGLAMALGFTILLAGNLAGASWIISSIFGWTYLSSLILISVIVFLYTIAGGLWSVVATDVAQSYPAVIAFIVAALWIFFTYGWDFLSASIPDGYLGWSGLTDPDNGAYLNWAGIIALALGDVVALDFMERVFAAKDPKTARAACYYGAGFTIITGVAASFIGLFALSLLSQVDDPRNVIVNMATEEFPFVLGLMVLGGIVGAGLSTADGGLLGVSSVFGRNFLQRNILKVGQKAYTEDDKVALDKRLLITTRLASIPIMGVAIWFAIIKPEPGILLVLAFDVVFAGAFVPLALGIYWKKANSAGALAGFLAGSGARVFLYFYIPEQYAGLDTLIAPVVCLIVMVAVALKTQESSPPKHYVLDYVPTDEQVLSTEY